MTLPPDDLQPVTSSAYLELIGPLAMAPDGSYWARIRPEHANTFGGAHGGLVASLVDVAVGRATRRVLDDGRAFRTVSMTVDYTAAAAVGDWLRFVVTLDHAGRRTVFVSCRVTVGDELIARASVVLAAVGAGAAR